jgi:sugar-specific transcriptional regulator TrmB
MGLRRATGMTARHADTVDELAQQLATLGLTPTEAAAYVHLLGAGPTRASSLAALIRLGRQDAYRILHALARRGFVVSGLGRPALYRATPPEEVSEARGRVEEVERARAEVLPALAKIDAAPPPPLARQAFRLLQGRSEYYTAVDRMIRAASREVKVLHTNPRAFEISQTPQMWNLVEARAAEGVRVRVLYRADPATRSYLTRHLGREELQVRHMDASQLMRFVVVDDESVTLSLYIDSSSGDDGGRDISVYSTATNLVLTQSVLFDEAWRNAAELRAPMQRGRSGARC